MPKNLVLSRNCSKIGNEARLVKLILEVEVVGMSFTVRTSADVLKLALPLYDYLSQNGHVEEADALVKVVDSCYPQDAQALDAHLRAFKQIRETVHDLPSQYLLALDDALEILSE